MSEISDLIDALPKVNQDAISVGFNSITSIKPLSEFLKVMFDNNARVINNSGEKNTEKRIKQYAELQRENKKRIEELEKNIVAASNDVRDSIDEQTNTIEQKEERDSTRQKQFEAKLFTTLKIISEGISKQFAAADKIAKNFIDLEQSGVFLKGGINSLGAAAADLGMTYEGLANQLKKTSPLIARLNSNMGDGLEIFKTTIQNIDDKYNLSRDEQVTAFEALMDKISPTQLRQMSQEELTMAVNETAKEMKLLSIATGKSVEQLKQEQQIKDKRMRIQAYARTHRQSFAILQALGFDDDMIDYIASGGARINSKILLQQMNDPAMQRMLPEMMMLSNTNRLNTATLGDLINRNRDILNYKTSYANNMSYNQAAYSASAMSENFEYGVYDNSWGERFANFNPNAEAMFNARGADNEMIRNVRDADREHNRYDVNVLDIKSGGREGINTDAKIRKGIYGTANFGLGNINNFLREKGWNGFLSGTLFSSLSAAVPHVGTYLGAGAEMIFFDAVMTFRDTVKGQEGWYKKIKDFLFSSKGLGRIALGGAGLGFGAFGLNQIWNKNQTGKSMIDTALEGGFYGLVAGAVIGGSINGDDGWGWGARAGVSAGLILGMAKNFMDNKDTGINIFDENDTVLGKVFKGTVFGAAIGGAIGGVKGAFWGAIAGAGASSIKALYDKYFGSEPDSDIKNKETDVTYSSPAIRNAIDSNIANPYISIKSPSTDTGQISLIAHESITQDRYNQDIMSALKEQIAVNKESQEILNEQMNILKMGRLDKKMKGDKPNS